MNNIKNANKIVIKVGTSTLTYSNGHINIRTLEKLVKVLSDLKNQGKDIVLVSSGAVGVGMGKTGMKERPCELRTKQALAAIGQCELMNYYDRLFSQYSHNVAQMLLTKDVVDDDKRYENAKNTFDTLINLGIIPVVNENDSVSTEQLEFGDNDTLSAYVADIIGADLLIILSDIDGLYDKDPNKNADATIINEVAEVNDYIKEIAGGTSTNRGTGGMITKIYAAEIATNSGVDMIITNGKNPDILYDIFDGKKIGTLFRRK